jgi:glyoxylase-like metal-dependent hydrolase (beta-lactamase superfamily II)
VFATWRATCGVLLLLLASNPGSAQEIGRTEIRSSKLQHDMYLLQGYGGNVVLSTGRDGPLLVDTEYAALTAKLVAAIARVTRDPVRIVVNTHWHNDHTGGNEAFGRAGAAIIAQQRSRERMMSDQVMSLYGPQAASAPAGQPGIGFTDSMQLSHNGLTIELIHVGPAHTDGDAAILFRDLNMLMTGDLFVGPDYRPPFFDDLNGGSLEGMIAAAQTLVSMMDGQTVVIPGHGDLATRTDVVQYLARLVEIRERIRTAIARGDDEDAVVSAKPVGDFAKAGRGTDRWVRVVYREYRNR